jgi:hypothetical protein
LDNKFSVGYESGLITLTTGAKYEPTGVESTAKAGEFKEILPSNDKVLIDGVEVELTAYKIDGSNYYKLRDLGEALGFGVDYTEYTDTMKLTK